MVRVPSDPQNVTNCHDFVSHWIMECGKGSSYHGEEDGIVCHVCGDATDDGHQARVVLLKRPVRQHVLDYILQEGVHFTLLQNKGCKKSQSKRVRTLVTLTQKCTIYPRYCNPKSESHL